MNFSSPVAAVAAAPRLHEYEPCGFAGCCGNERCPPQIQSRPSPARAMTRQPTPGKKSAQSRFQFFGGSQRVPSAEFDAFYMPTAEPVKIEPTAAPAPPVPAAALGSATANAPANVSLAPPSPNGHPSAAPSGARADAVPPSTNISPAEVAALAARSDIKIAMQGGDFGHVELHAKMAAEEFSASITVERHDAHAILAGDLPALHRGLE